MSITTNKSAMADILIRKKDGSLEDYNPSKIIVAVQRANERAAHHISEEEIYEVVGMVEKAILTEYSDNVISVLEVHNLVESALRAVSPDVATCYIEYRSLSRKWAKKMDSILRRVNKLAFLGDKDNANADSKLASTITCLSADYLGEEMYDMQFLTQDERQAARDGYIYLHDKGKRMFYAYNCCLFNVRDLLKGIRRNEQGEIIEERGGFEMANVWYNTPKSLKTAFSVIGDITLSAASQQYGGFTIPQADEILHEYAEMSYKKYLADYSELTDDLARAEAKAKESVWRDMVQGFQGWEYKFNTVASSRGDYPFITVTFGLGTSEWSKMASKAILLNRKDGQGKEGHKKMVLFPKLVFLYDENLHGPGKPLEDVFLAGIECSQKSMYPDWLSLSGDGYVPSMYKKYGLAISPMGCRAFLSPWYKRGGMEAADANDTPVFIGRFNIGAISLNLPMIYQKSVIEGKDFYEVLEHYLQMIRRIHLRTYRNIGQMPASRAPLAFCEGGLYGGNLGYNDKIAPCLKSATASFGVTALNELQMLYNGKMLTEDNAFALKVMNFINDRVNSFKKEDGRLYAIYGTPAEKLCGKQVEQFRTLYGIIPGVSDREYVSNSFHCHVSEDINAFEKQDYENEFWNLFNGGKIQYVKYPVDYNKEAYIALIRRAMEMGFYEGCNVTVSYCESCGERHINLKDKSKCPNCGSSDLTCIDRMNGYLSYSRVKGDTRLNSAKMAEISERKSM